MQADNPNPPSAPPLPHNPPPPMPAINNSSPSPSKRQRVDSANANNNNDDNSTTTTNINNNNQGTDGDDQGSRGETLKGCCASCGIAAVDGIKLKKCDACDLVKYCSDNCQEESRSKHEAMCKERAAELRDEILFRQPESTHLGDCPICFLPLPIDGNKSMLMGCCSKIICKGCDFANDSREMEERLQHTCPFCRHPVPKTDKEVRLSRMRRVEANDPLALLRMGEKHYSEGDYEGTFQYYSKAAEMGNAMAHYDLSCLYEEGVGVEKNEKMELYHLEEAAIAGHPDARYNLACYETKNKRYERAVKHFIIAANLGDDDSIQALKQFYVHGHVSKEDFAAALRAHQAAVDAMKSPQREAVAKAIAA